MSGRRVGRARRETWVRRRAAAVVTVLLAPLVSVVPAEVAAASGPPPAASWERQTNDAPHEAGSGGASLLSSTSAIISNGRVQLGVNASGALIAPGGTPSVGEGNEEVGLRFMALNTDALSPGCWCEGWGVGDPVTGESGSAYNAGLYGLAASESFEATASTAESTVVVGSVFRVTHSFAPAATSNAYAIDVTVENIDTTSHPLRYRRVMDWDVEPTHFDEYVTIAGSSPYLYDSTNDGFASSDPLDEATDLGLRGTFVDGYPPAATDEDHGALFDFNFGTLAAGQSRRFTLYYGATANEAAALSQLRALGTEVYSLGQPSTPDGPTLGTPNTFFFGFKAGVGAGPVGGPLTTSETFGGKNASHSTSVQCQIGAPVNCATGNFWHTFGDVSIPGRGPALALSRTYNAMGAASDSPFGYGWSSSYTMRLTTDTSGTVSISQENGATVAFTPDGSGGFTAAPRVLATLAANGDGTFTLTRRALERFTFSATGRLVAVSDLNGYTTALTYDAAGQLTTVTDPAGRALTFAYGANGKIASVTDPANRAVTYEYTAGNLTTVTVPGGAVTTFTYDASHRLLTMTDPRGGVTTNTFDATGRVLTQTDPEDNTTAFEYTSSGTTITHPRGNVEVHEYRDGELVALTRGFGTAQQATWRYAYDPDTLGITSIIDPNGYVAASRAYDTRGNVISSIDGLGRETAATYTPLDQPAAITDPLGVTTTFSYDAAGNLLSTSRPLSGTTQTVTTTYSYGDAAHPGDVTAVTDPDGYIWTLGYDAAGNRTSAADPLGNETTYAHDILGRVTSQVSPKGNAADGDPAAFTTTYAYDDAGNLTTVTVPRGAVTSFAYDANRNRSAVTNANGHTTTYGYDANNRLVTVTRADGTVRSYGYDANGNQTTQTVNGNTTSFAFDPLDRLASSTDPLNRSTAFGYDGAGNRTSLTDPSGRTTTFGYDDANQLVAINYSDPATPDVTLGYDDAGRRASMTDGTGTSTWTWDSLGRLVTHTNGTGKSVGYHWDLRGNLTAIEYPDGVGTVVRNYDAAGRWTSVTDWLGHTTTFEHDPNGNITAQDNANGTSTNYGFDEADRVMTIGHARDADPTAPFATFDYERDDLHQVTSVDSTGVPADTHTYGYTPLEQLAYSDSPASSFAYDAADNLSRFPDGRTQSFDAANELTATRSAIEPVWSGAFSEIGLSSSLPLTFPATQPGDQILIAVASPNDGSPPNTPPGYTLIRSHYTCACANSAHMAVYRRTSPGGDTATTITFGKLKAKSAVVAVYRGVDPVNPVDESPGASSVGTVNGGTSALIPPVTPTVPGARLVLLEGSAQHITNGWFTPPAGMTQRAHQTTTGFAAAGVADQPWPEPVATTTGTLSFSASAAIVGSLLTLRPAATTYTYDPQGNRTSVTTAGQTPVTLTYDQANRLTGHGTSTYRYDGDGLRASKTVGATTTSFVWSHAEGLPLLLVENGTNYVYGPGGRVVAQIQPRPPVALVATGAAADPVGNQNTLTANFAATQRRDVLVVGVTNRAGHRVVPSPQAGGCADYVTVATQPSGDGTKLTVFRCTAVDGQTKVTFSFPDTSASNLDVKTLAVAGYRNVDPADPIDGLSSANRPTTSTGTAEITLPSITTTQAGGQLVLVEGAASLVAAQGSFTQPSGMIRRAHATAQPTAEVTTDIADQPLGAAGATGTRHLAYTAPTASIEAIMLALKPAPTPMLWYHHDQLGSIRALTNNHAETVATYTYGAYGRLLGTTGNAPNPFGYAGEYTDAETGFVYLRARYYDPATAQFLTRDPIADITQQPYSYAAGNPLNLIDPSGLAVTLAEVSNQYRERARQAALSGDRTQARQYNKYADAACYGAGIRGTGSALDTKTAVQQRYGVSLILYTNGDWDIRLPAPMRRAPERAGSVFWEAVDRTVGAFSGAIEKIDEFRTAIQACVAGGIIGGAAGAGLGASAAGVGAVPGALIGAGAGCTGLAGVATAADRAGGLPPGAPSPFD